MFGQLQYRGTLLYRTVQCVDVKRFKSKERKYGMVNEYDFLYQDRCLQDVNCKSVCV